MSQHLGVFYVNDGLSPFVPAQAGTQSNTDRAALGPRFAGTIGERVAQAIAGIEARHDDTLEQVRETAARKHGRPGREIRPKSTTVDIHSHVAIPQAGAFVKPHLDMSSASRSFHFANAETTALSQKQEDDIRSRITAYDERLTDLDAMGIDMQLVMPPPNQCFYTVPLDISVKASQMVNDGLAEYVARKPDRFVALGTVPLMDGSGSREGARALHDARSR